MGAGDDRSNAGRAGGWLAYLPIAWLVTVLALSLRGVVLSLPVLSEQGLPAGIKGFIYASLVAGVVTVAWGLYVLVLAIVASPRFSRAFTAWQIAILVFLVAREIYVLATPAFVFSLGSHLWPALEAAMGLLCLALVGPVENRAAPDEEPASRPAGVVVLVVAALLGMIVGAALGFGVGLFLGAVLAEATDMSCFEGACGYFAAFIGLIGLVFGAIAGAIIAVWLVRRRNAAPA